MRYLALFHLSPAVSTHLSYIFEERRVLCYLPWRGEQKYQVTYVGVKSKIVYFCALLNLK